MELEELIGKKIISKTIKTPLNKKYIELSNSGIEKRSVIDESSEICSCEICQILREWN